MADRGNRPGKKIRLKGVTGKAIGAVLLLSCVLVIGSAALAVIKSVGKGSLSRHAGEASGERLSQTLQEELKEEESPLELEDGQILVEGRVYEYKEDLLTFLLLGVDSRSGIQKTKTPGKAGQADALLLVVADPQQENLTVLAINRDTMTRIEVYDTAGMYLEKETAQIALQYAYGDGREKSAALMEQAVSELLYGIPIHGYGVLDMQSIAFLNDAVGGVEVTVPEDMTKFKAGWTKGANVHLKGEDALLYVQRRDTAYLGTNLGRVERQKQYLTAYAGKLREKLKEDLSFPLTLFSGLQDHVLTSLTVQQIVYLADVLSGYSFSLEDIRSLPGESRMGEKHEEFYVQESALKELVIQVFYEPAEEEPAGRERTDQR